MVRKLSCTTRIFISLEQGSQVGVKLHRIDVDGAIVVAVFASVVRFLHSSDQVTLTGTGFQHCLDKGKVDSFQHFVCDGFWGWVKGIVNMVVPPINKLPYQSAN